MLNLGVYVFGLCVVRLGFEVRSAESSRDYGNYRTCQGSNQPNRDERQENRTPNKRRIQLILLGSKE